MYAEYWTLIENVKIEDDWERLSFMQHHGVPTRLLDWTENLNVAIYFAVAYSMVKKTGDPYIWVLNPYKLNELFCKKRVIFDAVDRVGYSYYKAALDRQFPHDTPLAMKPAWSNKRIRAQSGAFTIHGNQEAPLEELVSREVAERVGIDHSAVESVRAKILGEGINDYSIMGGPEGLALYVRQRYLRKKVS